MASVPGLDPVAGVSSVVGAFTDIANYRLNKKNYENQLDLQKYQKGVQETTWNREDTAISRRVQDLKNAGLNPVLAAGSAAQTSAPVSIVSPKREAIKTDSAFDNARVALALISEKENISNTLAQRELIKSQIASSDLSNAEKIYNLSKYKELGIPTNGGVLGKDVAGFFGLGTKASQDMKEFSSKVDNAFFQNAESFFYEKLLPHLPKKVQDIQSENLKNYNKNKVR